MNKRVVFKRYDQAQQMILLPSYDDLVPENHPVKVVDEVVERLEISGLEKSYRGGGTSSYHPQMLLKVVMYAYSGCPMRGPCHNAAGDRNIQ